MAKQSENVGAEAVTIQQGDEPPVVSTRRAFEAIYRDKGFVEVGRGNAEKAATASRPSAARRNDGTGSKAGTAPGSAADVAKSLNIENE